MDAFLTKSQSLQAVGQDHCRLRLKRWPNVKLRRLLGNLTWSRFWLNCIQKVKRSSRQARSRPTGFGRNTCQKVKLCKILGRVTRSRLWLNSLAKVQNFKAVSLPGKVTRSMLWLYKIRIENQTLKGVGQDHTLQTLIEVTTKCQVSKIGRTSYMIQVLVKTRGQSQAFNAVRQGHTLQAVLKSPGKI